MKHQTNWNKTLATPDDYPSSWDWTVAHSEYHFDNTIQDQPGDWFDVIGRFEGDWKEETNVSFEFSADKKPSPKSLHKLSRCDY